MKIIYLITLICYGCISWCHAQPNQVLTNDVPVNEWGTRQILISYTTLSSSTNALAAGTNAFIGDIELRADQPNYWILHNPSSDRAALLPNGGCFAFELKTTNGISIPKTEVGDKMIARPKSLTDSRGGNYQLGGGSFPALTDLFNFPSNGVYIFELRCWAWQNSKKQFALSDPIRVMVVKEGTNTSPTIVKPAKH